LRVRDELSYEKKVIDKKTHIRKFITSILKARKKEKKICKNIHIFSSV